MFALHTTIELARLTLIIGFVVALIFKKKFGFSPGGIIVPAFLTLILDKSPLWFITITLLSFPTFLLYKGWFGSRVLTARATALTMCTISTILVSFCLFVLVELHVFTIETFEQLFGFLLPALLAISYRQKGIGKTIFGTLFATIITYSLIILIIVLTVWLPNVDLSAMQELRQGRQLLEINHFGIQAIISLVVACFFYWRFKSRVGGLIVLPVVSALVFSPLNFLLFTLVTGLTYLFVTQIVMKYTLIYGLTRFVIMACLSTILVWIIEYFFLFTTRDFSPFLLSTTFVPVACGVLANDMAIQSPKKMFLPFMASLCIGVIISYFFQILPF